MGNNNRNTPQPNHQVQNAMRNQALGEMANAIAVLEGSLNLACLMIKDLYGNEENYIKAVARIQKEMQQAGSPATDPRIDDVLQEWDEMKGLMGEMLQMMRNGQPGKQLPDAIVDATQDDGEENIVDLGIGPDGKPFRPRK